MYYQSTLNVKYMYVSYGIYRWFKLIDCGELYGLNDSSTVKYMLKWLKILFDQSLDLFPHRTHSHTVFITMHLLICYLSVHRWFVWMDDYE